MAEENEPGRFLWLRSTAEWFQPDPFLDRQFQYIQSSLGPVDGVNDPVLIDIHAIDGVGGRSGRLPSVDMDCQYRGHAR